MSSMPSSSWISRLLVLALAVVPAAAHAQSLPKGYASDESPTAPAATTTASTPAPAPTMKPASSDDASVTATAQISTSADEYADTDPSALTDFQEPLQGYGSWVTDATYGTVWVPDSAIVGADFAPYQTEGYWSLDDDGEWLWVSTYDWGYVPFHYGRWVWISSYGWSWIPGRTYAPAWVTWRVSDYGYIGWAPLPPTYYWVGGAALFFNTAWSAAYVFCPTSYVFHTHVHTYIVHDKATVKSVAAHSRTYKPASPSASASAGSGSSAKSGSGSASSVKKPSGPSMKEAGIADAVVPKKRATVDARAQMFSKKSTTTKAKQLVKTQRAALLGSAGSSHVSRAGSSIRKSGGAATSATAPATTRGVQPSFSRGATSRGATTSPGGSSVSAPASRGQGVIRTPGTGSRAVTSPPSRGSSAVPSSRGSAPAPANVSRPAPRASTPSVSAPRASAPRASTPSAPRASTPSPSRSSSPSPSRSSSPSPSRGGRR